MGKRGPQPIHCMPGDRYGRLVILYEAEPVIQAGRNRRQVMCLCECGKEKAVPAAWLRSGAVQSCGCLHDTHRLKHGHASNGELSLTYRSWMAMRMRCMNPDTANYQHYGGRGIEVCDRWEKSFEAFLEDMGERPSARHSIDRHDSNGDYSPDNCRWATPRQQARNRSNNRMLTHNGETMCLIEWAERIGIKPNALQARLNVSGYTVEEALTTPHRGKRNG